MKIQWLQHVPFEGLGSMESCLRAHQHTIACTQLWNGDPVPAPDTLDGLIVMGGPMGVHDEAEFPWLAQEKALIRSVIGQNKPVLGICLGAQLIATVLGAKVQKNDHREIGFFPLTGDGRHFPKHFTAFHWHGDTFELPGGAVHLASSQACKNQAFQYNARVLALQFHLETTAESLQALYKQCSAEVTDGPFIQTATEAMAQRFSRGDLLKSANALMEQQLIQLFGKPVD